MMYVWTRSNTFIQTGPLWYLWLRELFVICAIGCTSGNKRWRRILAIGDLGFVINVGMWLERYVIIPET